LYSGSLGGRGGDAITGSDEEVGALPYDLYLLLALGDTYAEARLRNGVDFVGVLIGFYYGGKG
jgi:hypothetical protein